MLRARLRAATAAGERAARVTAAEWDEPEAGALWCIRHRDAAWLVLVRDGARPRIAGRAGYRLLLELLEHRGERISMEPHEAWRDVSLRLARRLLRRLLRRQPQRVAEHSPAPDRRFQRGLVYPVDPAAAETAVQLRRWLASRPGGASADEAAVADRWMEELRAAAPAAPTRGHILFPDSELEVVAGILLVTRRNAASRGTAAG